MGRPKLLLPFRGDTVIGSLVAALREGGVGRIVVVRAAADAALAAWCRGAGVGSAVNPQPERGMLTSIHAGLAALGGAPALREERLLVSPADLPLLTAGTVAELLRVQATLAVPTYRGRRGHPLLVAGPLIAEIELLDPTVGLRQLLERCAAEAREIPVEDPGVVLDVDTAAAYEAAVAASGP
jgi:molybdenum cofactor cytidylyltransferase